MTLTPAVRTAWKQESNMSRVRFLMSSGCHGCKMSRRTSPEAAVIVSRYRFLVCLGPVGLSSKRVAQTYSPII